MEIMLNATKTENIRERTIPYLKQQDYKPFLYCQSVVIWCFSLILQFGWLRIYAIGWLMMYLCNMTNDVFMQYDWWCIYAMWLTRYLCKIIRDQELVKLLITCKVNWVNDFFSYLMGNDSVKRRKVKCLNKWIFF
jgi:hypothetical protein